MTTGTGARSAYLAGAMAAAEIEPPLLPGRGRPLTQLVMDAHYKGDLEEMQRLTLRAEAGIAPCCLSGLSDDQLETRRNRIHVLLASVNDELQRRGRTRNHRLQAQKQAAAEAHRDAIRPLDASGDDYPGDLSAPERFPWPFP